MADSGPENDGSLSSQVRRVRRYWWVVAAMTLACGAVGLLSWISTASTYTGRASLIMSSEGRAPDQDAVLVQGFAAYLNSPPYQAKLSAEGVLPAGTSVEARTSAGSPILLVDVTSTREGEASSAASAVAKRFSTDMNEGVERRGAALSQQLQSLVADIAQGGDPATASGQQPQAALAALREQLDALRTSRSNILDVLQLRGGVTTNRPSVVRTVGLGVVGGLMAGVLLALLIGRLSGRLRTCEDLEELDGLTVLSDTVLDARSPTYPSEIRGLAAFVGARTERPGALAVAATSENGTADLVAHQIAGEWARSGRSVLVVLSDMPSEVGAPLSEEGPEVPRGLQKLGGSVVRGALDGLWVMTPDTARSGAASLVEVGVRAVEALANDAAASVDSVLVAAPGVGTSGEAEALCVVAGRAVLLVDPAQARFHPTWRALDRLTRNEVDVLGGVLVRRPDHDVAKHRS